MKKRRTLLFFTRCAAGTLAGVVLLACYAIVKKNTFMFYIELAIAIVVLCIGIALFLFASTPSKEIRQRWKSYSELIETNLARKGAEICARIRDEEYDDLSQETQKVEAEQESAIDYKLELEAMRANYKVDTDKSKNRIEKSPSINERAAYDFSALETGKIVYGCEVMANSAMYNKKRFGAKVLPMVIVYSPDDYFEQNPYALKDIARELLKNRRNNILKNETDYYFNVKLDAQITGGREVYITVVLGYRHHLPFGCLPNTLTICPIIAAPKSSSSAFIIDSKYWTNGFLSDYFSLTIKRDIGDPIKGGNVH